MATHSSICLENSMDRGPWQATVHTVTKSQTGLTMHAQRKMSRYWIGSHSLLLIKSIHTLSVLIQKLPLIRMPEIWTDGLSVFQNHLWSFCSAMITFKGNRDAISIHHWEEGQSCHHPHCAGLCASLLTPRDLHLNFVSIRKKAKGKMNFK